MCSARRWSGEETPAGTRLTVPRSESHTQQDMQ
jgi:hypothetical protein